MNVVNEKVVEKGPKKPLTGISNETIFSPQTNIRTHANVNACILLRASAKAIFSNFDTYRVFR